MARFMAKCGFIWLLTFYIFLGGIPGDPVIYSRNCTTIEYCVFFLTKDCQRRLSKLVVFGLLSRKSFSVFIVTFLRMETAGEVAG